MKLYCYNINNNNGLSINRFFSERVGDIFSKYYNIIILKPNGHIDIEHN